MKKYSLRKSKHILRHAYHLFKKKKKKLSPETQALIKESLLALQQEVLDKNREKASELAKQVESLCSVHMKKTGFDQLRELVFALAFALCVAVLIRQMWFEFYEIPSGSMRPTFKEQDRLVVSKTNFGINIPLTPEEFYFDPNLVQRGGIVIFTGENMDIHDVDTMYFYIFPGKKQYVKRMIGKPGDILYFYGGRIYGFDKEGNDISSAFNNERLSAIDHIPFIDFDRKIVVPPTLVGGVFTPVFIYQMNEPVVKLSVSATKQVSGEMVNPPQIHAAGAPPVADYGDLWGFNNYGMTRLLTRDQVKYFTDQNPTLLEEGQLYLEIRHHPTLKTVRLIRDEMGRMRPTFGLSTSIIPLQEKHLRAIFDHLYTARFVVKNGVAFRYGADPKSISTNIYLAHLPYVPDGCYEFYDGIAYQVKWQGITEKLPPSHPIYHFDSETVQLFYNIGIEWDTCFAPHVKNQRLIPSRYAYYREGDLYLMGAPILMKDDPTLTAFLENEGEREKTSNPQAPYLPFADSGPPLLANGELNVDLIRQNGLLIPPNMYCVLGDNYAMSSDSRDFGFVPQANLRGAPDFIFWPPGPRWGAPNQPHYPFFNLPRTVVWILAFIGFGGGYLYWRRHSRFPFPIDKQ